MQCKVSPSIGVNVGSRRCKSERGYMMVVVFLDMRNLVRRVGHSALQGAGQVDVEEGPVHALHNGDLAAVVAVRMAGGQIAGQLILVDGVAVCG